MNENQANSREKISNEEQSASAFPNEQPAVDPETLAALRNITDSFQRMTDALSIFTKPGKILYLGLLTGLARGLGMALGATVLVAVLIAVLSRMVDIPLIGGYIAEIVDFVQKELRAKP